MPLWSHFYACYEVLRNSLARVNPCFKGLILVFPNTVVNITQKIERHARSFKIDKVNLLPVSTASKVSVPPVSTASKVNVLPVSTASKVNVLPVSTASKVNVVPVSTVTEHGLYSSKNFLDAKNFQTD